MEAPRKGKVERLFEEALARPEKERAAFLEETCGEEALRKEVASLLKAYKEAPDFFEGLASSVVAPMLERLEEGEGSKEEEAPAASDPLGLEGTFVGRYHVEEHLGSGGMGVVYRARDPELDRPVALKFLPPHLSWHEEAERRFLREARSAAALDLSNVATIHEIGRAEDGRRFIAMAYYEGETLKEKLSRQGALPVEEALSYAKQIAEGLARAHEAGIVHRDVKPANVMVTERGRVKLLDFGIAKLKGGQRITETGDTLGTVAYMAPEQLQGREVGRRADLFSLGVVLYEMLTGRHPFPGEHRQAIAYQIINEEAEPPSTYREELSAKVDEVVLRCLEKEPTGRYGSAEEVLSALREAMPKAASSASGVGGSASEAENLLSGRDWLKKRRMVGLGALAVVALLMGWWLLGGDSGEDPAAEETLDADRVAVFPFAVRGSEELEYLGESMVELMSRSIDGAGPLRAVDPKALLVQLREGAPEEGVYREVGPEEAREVAAGFDAGRFVLGSIDRVGNDIRLRATWYGTDGEELGSADVAADGEEEIQEAIDALARSAISDLAGEEASHRQRLAAQTTSSVEALKAYLEGQAALRRNDWGEAQEAFERAVETDPGFALAHYRLGAAAGWAGDFHLGHRAARRAVELSEDLPERDRRLIQARHAYAKGRAEEAERLYRALVDAHPEDVDAWYGLGETLFHFNSMRGRPITEAKGPLGTALELDPTANEPLFHLIQIAAIEQDRAGLDTLTSGLERRNLADDFEMGFRASRAYLLDESPVPELDEGDPLFRTADLLRLWGKFQDAEELLRRLIRPDRPEEVRATAHVLLAALLAGQGKLEAAREELKAVAPLDRAAHMTRRGLLATLPFLPESEKEREERQHLLRQISNWDAKAVPERLLPTPFLPPAEVYPPAQPYLLGLLRAEEGEQNRALEAAARLDEMEAPELVPSGPSDLARAVEAEVERQEGNPEEALRRLEALQHQIDPVLVLLSFYSGARERYLRAELLAEVGRFEEALAWYETLFGAPGESPYLGPAHFGRAQALEELGREEEAAEAYERFLELWKDADPALQPMVEEAQERLESLDEEGALPAPQEQ